LRRWRWGIDAPDTSVCQFRNEHNPPVIGVVYTHIVMNSNMIVYLSDPVYAHEAASKNYVDRRFLTMPFPSLERSISKSGFIVSSSSHYNALHEVYGLLLIWKIVENGQLREKARIQISCLSPVRRWKIRLTGRISNSERITSRELSGGTGESHVLTDIYLHQ